MRVRSPRAAERGFSLLELVVGMFIAAQILIAAAVAFDVHSKMARVQTQITDLQQSLRIGQYDVVRMVRMAGRGSLPVELDPDAIYDPSDTIPELRGFAIEVRNNVAGDERFVARGDATSPQAIEGSDLLTVRGCFSGTVYQVNPEEWTTTDTDGDDIADQATIPIPKTSQAGLTQALGGLVEEIDAYGAAAIKGRLNLTSKESLQTYGVGNVLQLAVTGSVTDPDSVTVTLDLATNSTLNPVDDETGVRGFPEDMAPQLLCLLEEYRYYVRAVAGDAVTPVRPRLTRARFEPGTEQPYLGDDSNLTLDLADGLFDLQVALGLDTDYCSGCDLGEGAFRDDEDELGPDDVLFEADLTDDDADGTIDDWLYNDPADRPADSEFVLHANGTNAGNVVQTYFVRVTTAARTTRPDRGYRAPELDTRTDGDWIEDHDFDSGAGLSWNSGDALLFRRRTLTTVVDLRNAQ
jgi:hypothetical protein